MNNSVLYHKCVLSEKNSVMWLYYRAVLQTEAHGPASCTLLALVSSEGPSLVLTPTGKVLWKQHPAGPWLLCSQLIHPFVNICCIHWPNIRQPPNYRVLSVAVQEKRSTMEVNKASTVSENDSSLMKCFPISLGNSKQLGPGSTFF